MLWRRTDRHEGALTDSSAIVHRFSNHESPVYQTLEPTPGYAPPSAAPAFEIWRETSIVYSLRNVKMEEDIEPPLTPISPETTAKLRQCVIELWREIAARLLLANRMAGRETPTAVVPRSISSTHARIDRR